MPAPDFLPGREAELVTWSTSFDQKTNASPLTYGLTVAQASAYTVRHDAFLAAYALTSNAATNSRSNVVTKRDAKKALIAEARLLARIIQAAPGTTNTMRSDLGLTVRDGEPSPRPVPSQAPMIEIKSVVGHKVSIRLIDRENPTRRGKPANVAGATVFSFVGEVAPTNLGLWKFEGNITRTILDIAYGDTVPAGSKVFLTAFWRNARDASGPACDAVIVYLGGGLSMAA